MGTVLYKKAKKAKMADQFVSGSDILSNTGNAGLGYSSGVAYNANPADTNPFAAVQSTLTQVTAHEAQKRALERERQLKEHDDLAKYLTETGTTAFNQKGPNGEHMGMDMLPEDRAIVNAAADDLNKTVVANPRTYKFDPAIREKETNFRQLVRQASLRAIDVASKQQMAAKENNPIERARILENIQGNRGKPVSDFATPEPYLPKEKYNITDFVAEDVLSGKNKEAYTETTTAGLDKNGNEITTTQKIIRPDILDIREKAKQGTATYGSAVNMARSFYESPAAQSPQAILDMNGKIDQLNASPAYKDHQIPHIAEVLPSGKIKYNNLDAPSVSYALLAETYGHPISSTDVERTAATVGKEKTELQFAKDKNRREESDLKLKWAKFEDDKSKLSKDEKAAQLKELNARTTANTIHKVLANVKGLKPLDEVMNSVPESDRSGLAQSLADYGFDNSNYQVGALNSMDATVKYMAGIQYMNKEGQLQKGSSAPKYSYVMMPKSGNMSEAKLVFGYPTLQDVVYPPGDAHAGEVKMNGTKPVKERVIQWKVSSPQEAINSYISARGNFSNITPAMQGEMDRSIDYLTDLLGGKKTPEIPNAQPTEAPSVKSFTYNQQGVNSVLEQHKNLNFVDRYLNPDKYPVIENKDGTHSTHLMASSDNFVYPTIIQGEGGKLKKLSPQAAYKHAIETGEYIKMPDEKSARWMAENGYKKGTQNTSTATPIMPQKIKELIGTGEKAIPITEAGENYWQIGKKIYKENGEEVK